MSTVILVFLALAIIFMLVESIFDTEGVCGVISLIFLFIGISIGTIGYFSLQSNESSKYKIDLPEEIENVKSGDTLFVNKKIKDSIYLGFKSNEVKKDDYLI